NPITSHPINPRCHSTITTRCCKAIIPSNTFISTPPKVPLCDLCVPNSVSSVLKLFSFFKLSTVDCRLSTLLFRLLLCHTMQSPQSQNQIPAMYPHHLTPRKQSPQSIQRHSILRIIKRRHNHNPVRNIKIRITSRQPLPIKINRRRHRQSFHVQRPPILILHPFQPPQILLQRRKIRFPQILLHNRHHSSLIYKPTQIIHMPVRIVPRNPIPQPQNIRNAQIFPKPLRIIFLRKSRIPLLHLTLQTLLRSQQRPPPIHVNRPAFQHHPPPLMLRKKDSLLPPPIRLPHHQRILLMIRILRPPIKHKIVVRNLSCRIFHANRARIPHPPPVRRHNKKFHRLQLGPGLLQNPPHPLFR